MSPGPSTNLSEAAHPEPVLRPGPLARWAPAVVWAICIWWFSTGAFSARSTNAYIDPLLRFFLGDLSLEAFRLAHAAIRKAAHFTEYAVLAILIGRAITLPNLRIGPAVIGRTILYCAIYAVADELHQTFEVTRTGSPSDVAVDVLGATAGMILLARWRGSGGNVPHPDGRAPHRISARSRG